MQQTDDGKRAYHLVYDEHYDHVEVIMSKPGWVYDPESMREPPTNMTCFCETIRNPLLPHRRHDVPEWVAQHLARTFGRLAPVRVVRRAGDRGLLRRRFRLAGAHPECVCTRPGPTLFSPVRNPFTSGPGRIFASCCPDVPPVDAGASGSSCVLRAVGRETSRQCYCSSRESGHRMGHEWARRSGGAPWRWWRCQFLAVAPPRTGGKATILRALVRGGA
jgi:hypothetical protein